jgi:hypothetical protein
MNCLTLTDCYPRPARLRRSVSVIVRTTNSPALPAVDPASATTTTRSVFFLETPGRPVPKDPANPLGKLQSRRR